MEGLKETISLSHYSSILRKVPLSLWEKILEYAQEPQAYTLRDCGSRNGTFLMDCGVE